MLVPHDSLSGLLSLFFHGRHAKVKANQLAHTCTWICDKCCCKSKASVRDLNVVQSCWFPAYEAMGSRFGDSYTISSLCNCNFVEDWAQKRPDSFVFILIWIWIWMCARASLNKTQTLNWMNLALTKRHKLFSSDIKRGSKHGICWAFAVSMRVWKRPHLSLKFL